MSLLICFDPRPFFFLFFSELYWRCFPSVFRWLLGVTPYFFLGQIAGCPPMSFSVIHVPRVFIDYSLLFRFPICFLFVLSSLEGFSNSFFFFFFHLQFVLAQTREISLPFL